MEDAKIILKLVSIFIVYRAASILLLSFFGATFHSLDGSTDIVFNKICSKECRQHNWMRGFYRWDAIHFGSIAMNGYVNEKNGAFFPLYPWILKKGSDLISVLKLVECPVGRLVLSGLLISSICGLFSVPIFYWITLRYNNSWKRFAFVSTVYFICNPAIAFHTAL